MIGYIVRRLAQGLFTLFLLSILFFLLTRLGGYNPCSSTQLGCTEALHLDQPITTQYFIWLGQILQGNFGISSDGEAVGSIIAQRFPATLILIGVSLILQQLIALPLGVLAALRPYSLADQVLTFISYVFLSVPAFLLGFLLLEVFGLHWQIFAIGHSADVALPLLGTPAWFGAMWQDPGYVLGDLMLHLVLPAVSLIATGIAIDSRFMRASMLQVLHEDYIRTARAKGLPRRAVIFKHAFRNALLPIVVNLGLYLPALIGGAVVVETVFTWGGLGYEFSQAIGGPSIYGGGDRTILLALVMLSALAVVLANLLADLAYAWLDPRIRFEDGQA